MRWLDGITDSMDMSFSELSQEAGLACCDHGVAKSRTQLSDWTELNGLISQPKRVIAALVVGITALIAIIASVTVSAVALSKEVHMASFVNQLSKNVSIALTKQEIIDKKIENKVNALEEAVLLIGQEITNLKIKLSLRCHAEFK